MKLKTQVIKNFVELPYTCVSLFIEVGMKDDLIHGMSHLTEHIIIEELMKKEPVLFDKCLINAYVDKEFTCFYATVLRKDLNELLFAFNHLFDCMENEISKEIIETQKNIIFNIENERILSNPQLVNILLLEQNAFTGSVKNPTIVDKSFFVLDESKIKEFYRQTYLGSQQYLIISGDVADLNYEKILDNDSETLMLKSKNIPRYDNENNIIPIPLYNFDDIEDIRKTVAVTIEPLSKLHEYYALHIICMLYKVLINNVLKDEGIFIKDITFKLYSEKYIIFFGFNCYYDNTASLLRDIEIEKYSDFFKNIKKHFLYGYLKKTSDILAFNKEIYKIFRFFGESLNFKNMVGFIKKVKFSDILMLHNKILDGNYFIVPENNGNGNI